jgi:uncharacterized protein (TIGR02271 family)
MAQHGEQPTEPSLEAGRAAVELPGAHTYRVSGSEAAPPASPSAGEAERTIELREEQLVAHKELGERGEIRVRTTVEEVPGRLEVEAYREEVEVEHEPVGQVVKERVGPWEEEGVLVVPVYEEQLVVVKRLVLKEHLRVRRVTSTERQLFEDTLRRDRLVIEDPNNTGLVHEQYPTDAAPSKEQEGQAQHEGGSMLEKVVRKVLD